MPVGAEHFPGTIFPPGGTQDGYEALRHKDYGIWKRISWNEYGEAVREVAAG